MTTSSSHDFDFLHGDWNVRNIRLRERLVGSAEWVEFYATLEVRPVLLGLGNTDRFAPTDGEYEGLTVRLFSPDARTWTIYWADSRRGVLDPPLVGTFAHGIGTFYGDDAWNGRKVRVRFIWRDPSANGVRWEQAFSVDGGESWETNWIMEFERR
jgi:hypothetical protein